MPNRVIKESIKRSPQIDSLTWFEEVVFCRLIVTVDDYGCTDGRAVVLKNDLFPTKENVTKKAIEDAVSKLIRVGLVQRYEVDGRPYLFLPSWEKHQRVRNRHRKYPEPVENHLSANCCQMTADCPPESESNPNPNPIRIQREGASDAAPRARFVKPTLEQVRGYCAERCNSVDAQRFIDYYESNGWRVGKNPMKDWRAAVRTWERGDGYGGSRRSPEQDANLYGERI